jgi:hypothetical protein
VWGSYLVHLKRNTSNLVSSSSRHHKGLRRGSQRLPPPPNLVRCRSVSTVPTPPSTCTQPTERNPISVSAFALVHCHPPLPACASNPPPSRAALRGQKVEIRR